MLKFDENKTYWAGKGQYEKEYDELRRDLVPQQGEADTPNGELLRAVGNRYYDLLNNGDCQHLDGLDTIEKRAKDILRIDRKAPVPALVASLRNMYEARHGEDASEFGWDPDEFNTDRIWAMFEPVIDAVLRMLWIERTGVDPAAEKIANATSRGNGAVGKNALVPRYVAENVHKGKTILDFGAGSKALHARHLDCEGFEHVTAWECGRNFDEGVHDRDALIRKYEVVYASNVLNVQSSWADVVAVVRTIHSLMEPGAGSNFILNLPVSPRKGAWSLEKDDRGEDAASAKTRDRGALMRLLRAFFLEVKIVGGAKWAPVIRAHHAKRSVLEVPEGPRED